MTIFKLIECDGRQGRCGNQGPSYRGSDRPLRNMAKAEGWSYEGLRDFCPHCTESRRLAAAPSPSTSGDAKK